MNDDYINGFKDGFMSGVDIKGNFKISLFGMDAAKVLTILADYVKKQPTMINIIDKNPVIIMRDGKEIYRD